VMRSTIRGSTEPMPVSIPLRNEDRDE